MPSLFDISVFQDKRNFEKISHNNFFSLSHSSTTKENVIEGMKDIVAEAAESVDTAGMKDGIRKFVIIVLTSPVNTRVSLVNNIKILLEGG